MLWYTVFCANIILHLNSLCLFSCYPDFLSYLLCLVILLIIIFEMRLRESIKVLPTHLIFAIKWLSILHAPSVRLQRCDVQRGPVQIHQCKSIMTKNSYMPTKLSPVYTDSISTTTIAANHKAIKANKLNSIITPLHSDYHWTICHLLIIYRYGRKGRRRTREFMHIWKNILKGILH